MTARPTTTIPKRLPHGLPAAILTAVAAVGATMLTAPAAQADLATVQTQCAGLGGDYTFHPAGGVSSASCCYKSLDGSGKTVCDYYDENGNFTGSSGDTTKPTLHQVPPGMVAPWPTAAQPGTPEPASPGALP